ncbi:magnesium transporter CorA family protein [Candidatus Woesearchaeota archaeon]|nr:magnesium transporter CorA family protein [Candidatus Woesearchaeota archaeon]
MIVVTSSTKEGVQSSAIADLSNQETVTFVDCLHPTSKEIDLIAVSAGIPKEEILEATDPDERPRVLDTETYSLIIYRTPTMDHHRLKTTPIAVFFNHAFVICIRHAENETFDRFSNFGIEQKQKLMQNSSCLTYWLIDDIQNNFFTYMDRLEDQIDHLESKIYKYSNENVVKEIFDFKKILIYFHKALTANREVINSIEKEYLKFVGRKEIKRFRNTYNDVVELLDMESMYRDILTGAMDMHLTTISNNLNVVIKKMTAMGSFILIPTLISGVYGMNFIYLPETHWQFGYPFALFLMGISVVLLYIFFKKKTWI